MSEEMDVDRLGRWMGGRDAQGRAVRFTYDDNGTRHMWFDNREVQAMRVDGRFIEHVYNDAGERIHSRIGKPERAAGDPPSADQGHIDPMADPLSLSPHAHVPSRPEPTIAAQPMPTGREPYAVSPYPGPRLPTPTHDDRVSGEAYTPVERIASAAEPALRPLRSNAPGGPDPRRSFPSTEDPLARMHVPQWPEPNAGQTDALRRVGVQPPNTTALGAGSGAAPNSIDPAVTTRYVYDISNRLVQVVSDASANGPAVSLFYQYDFQNRLIHSSDEQGQRYFVYDEDARLAEYGPGGTFQARYEYGNDRPILMTH
jgi:YD repeat-containing protein